MHNKYLLSFCLLLIILLGAFLRLSNLGNNPNGFYVDEAATGYNAYSILQTGKDEYGKSFPIFLRSFAAYPSPLYTYVTTIFVAIFGLHVSSIRFLSFLCGVISIPLVFLILKQLRIYKNRIIPLLGTLIFAISPWSIFFSRGAYEANLAFTLILLVILLLLLGRVRKVFIIPAFAVLSLSTYAYQAERLIAYLLLFGYLLIYYRSKIFKEKVIIASILLFIVLQIPQILISFTPAFTFRQSGLFYSESIKNGASKMPVAVPAIVSQTISFAYEFFAQTFSYLSPRNLFFEPDPDLQRSLPSLSVFYPWLVLPYLVGFYFFIKKRKEKTTAFIVLLIVSFLVAPALTGDPFSTLRSLPLLLPILIIISIGFDNLLNFEKKMIWVILFFMVFSVLPLYRSLAVLLPNERAKIWGYGFSALAEEIKKRPEEKFLIDTSRTKPPYIELAFFLKFPPEKFQQSIDQSIKEHYYENVNWDGYYNFGQIETRPISWKDDIYKKQVLVGDELAISEEQAKEHFLTQIFEIKDPTQGIVFKGYETDPISKCHKNYDKDKCQI